MKQFFTLLSALIISGVSYSQIVINEVIYTPAQTVEIKNLGSNQVDVGAYWLCSFPTYTQLQNMTIISGSTMLNPGELLVVSGHTYGATDDELGLYTNSGFGNPSLMIDYVEWGSTGHTRSGVAVSAGVWSTGDFVDNTTGVGSLEYDGTGDSSSDWQVSDAHTEGEENSNIPVGCDASAFVIGNQTICPGGTATFQLILTGVAPWTFTYSLDGNIQAPITTSLSPYPWEITEPGTYIMNTVEDANCEGSAQGTVQVTMYETPTATLVGPTEFCSTDTAAAIFADLTGVGPWEISYQIDGAPQGTLTTSDNPAGIPISSEGLYTLVGFSDAHCEGTFEGSMEVSFVVVDGGSLSQDGSTSGLVLCTDDNQADEFTFDTVDNVGQSSQIVVTDESGEILLLPSGSTIDFEGFAAGTCSVWNISYLDGLIGLEVGNTIPGEILGCYSLSNPISVLHETGIDCTTSLSESDLISGLNLYPNPVNDVLNVSFQLSAASGLQFSILDMSGRVISQERIAPTFGLVQRQLDVNGIMSGMYLLEIQDEIGNRTTASFVK